MRTVHPHATKRRREGDGARRTYFTGDGTSNRIASRRRTGIHPIVDEHERGLATHSPDREPSGFIPGSNVTGQAPHDSAIVPVPTVDANGDGRRSWRCP